MRHAILIIAHTDPKVIEYNIRLLDSSSIDFYLHIDKKSKDNFLYLRNVPVYSHIYFIPQINIHWGGQAQIQAELNLFRAASNKGYDYFHLISGQDMVLKRCTEFLSFFEENRLDYLKISNQTNAKMLSRVKYYHPIFQTNLSRSLIGWKIDSLFVKLQAFFHVNRCENLPVCFGENWCSLTDEFVSFLLQKDTNGFIKNKFYYAENADEIYKQTIYKMWVGIIKLDKHTNLNIRYVDWSENRESPKTLNLEDYNSLKNSEYLFARKLTSKNDLPETIFNELIRK